MGGVLAGIAGGVHLRQTPHTEPSATADTSTPTPSPTPAATLTPGGGVRPRFNSSAATPSKPLGAVDPMAELKTKLTAPRRASAAAGHPSITPPGPTENKRTFSFLFPLLVPLYFFILIY